MTGKAPRKVLVAEVEEAGRRRLATIVDKSERYQALEAADGRSALQMLLAEQPEFVLLGYDLPVLTGPEVLQALEYVFEERPELARVQIVAMTAKHSSWKRQEVEHRLVADYLSNGCDSYRLVRTLDNLARAAEHEARVEAERYKKQGIKMLFSAMMDVTQEGFLLVNRQGTISYANPGAGRILGLGAGESLFGEPISSILGDELAELLVGNATAPAVITDISRKTVRLSKFRGDRETIINFTLYPYHGPDGSESGIIFHLRDLDTLRQELERAVAAMNGSALPAPEASGT
jgi:PAS domain S-box-containing protein